MSTSNRGARTALFMAAGFGALIAGGRSALAADQPSAVGEVVVTAQRRSENVQKVGLMAQNHQAPDKAVAIAP